MKRVKKYSKNENGAVVVEASLALPVFLFAIVSILMIINIGYAQMKIGVALAMATKELSQYAYINKEISGFVGEKLGKIGELTGAEQKTGEFLSGTMKDAAPLFIKKNLKSFKNDSADAFLRRLGVVDGHEGLHTDISIPEDSSKIRMTVLYKVEPMRLFNIDYQMSFVQTAESDAWLGGKP